MFHSLEKVFQTCDSGESANRKEVLSLKKLKAEDCTWSTCQVLLGWVIDMVNTDLSLTPHREDLFKEILAGITTNKKHSGIDKCNRVLGEICSLAAALPDAGGFLYHMKEKWLL